MSLAPAFINDLPADYRPYVIIRERRLILHILEILVNQEVKHGHPDRGFRFRLSRAEPNSTASLMRILVVEDHQDTLQVLSHLLQHWGFDVAVAQTLQKGLNFLETERFDAIVSDISLPDGTGYALVSQAKRQSKDVLTIALSGYACPGDIQIGKLAGFDHHLTKPCDCQELRSILQEDRPGEHTALQQ